MIDTPIISLRATIVLLCAALLLPNAAAAQSDPWVGRWASPKCQPDATEIELSKSTMDLSTFEAVCAIRRVRYQGGLYEFEAICRGEGGKKGSRRSFSVRVDGDTLEFVRQVGFEFDPKRFFRCGKQQEEQARTSALSDGRSAQAIDSRYQALPSDVRAYVSDVRGKCTAYLDQIPQQDRQGINYIPNDAMQGIRHFELNGRPAIIADNFDLCTTDIPGANCTNRGCDLAVWRQDPRGSWRRVFHAHLHDRVALEFDPSSQRLRSMSIRLYAGDQRCRPPPNRQYTSGQNCHLVARYKNGQWEYRRAR